MPGVTLSQIHYACTGLSGLGCGIWFVVHTAAADEQGELARRGDSATDSMETPSLHRGSQ